MPEDRSKECENAVDAVYDRAVANILNVLHECFVGAKDQADESTCLERARTGLRTAKKFRAAAKALCEEIESEKKWY